MSSSHTCLRAEECSCGSKLEPFSAYSEEDDDEERRTKIRRQIITTNSELPEDVLLEILLRLPVKSLLRFKCVCKYWYDLIRSPEFMSLHDNNSIDKKKRVSLYCHSYSHDDDGGSTTIYVWFFNTPIDLKIPACVERVKLVGCSNGLVCLSLSPRYHHQFALWNPATNQSRLIFETHLSRPKDARIYSGFCFDSIANTYKVVRATLFPRKNSLSMVTVPEGSVYVILHVFALNDNNSWREKELLAPCRVPDGGFMSGVTYVGRRMYWTVVGYPDEYILCFDMVDELFKIIELPLPCQGHRCRRTGLFDYKGSLAMFIWEKSVSGLPESCFDMWVLNDCGGTNHSWCKQLTLRPPVSNVMWPLGFFCDGNVELVVLYTSGQCLCWDRDSGETTEAIFDNGYVNSFFLYSESFASVF